MKRIDFWLLPIKITLIALAQKLDIDKAIGNY